VFPNLLDVVNTMMAVVFQNEHQSMAGDEFLWWRTPAI
jgi:hypothetical protein